MFKLFEEGYTKEDIKEISVDYSYWKGRVYGAYVELVIEGKTYGIGYDWDDREKGTVESISGPIEDLEPIE